MLLSNVIIIVHFIRILLLQQQTSLNKNRLKKQNLQINDEKHKRTKG